MSGEVTVPQVTHNRRVRLLRLHNARLTYTILTSKTLNRKAMELNHWLPREGLQTEHTHKHWLVTDSRRCSSGGRRGRSLNVF